MAALVVWEVKSRCSPLRPLVSLVAENPLGGVNISMTARTIPDNMKGSKRPKLPTRDRLLIVEDADVGQKIK